MHKTQTSNYGLKLRLSRQRRASAALLVCIGLLITSCAHQPIENQIVVDDVWIKETAQYRSQLPLDHADRSDDILEINAEMRETLQAAFSDMPRHRVVKHIADWLMLEAGHGMTYDVNANLAPREAYSQRRGNCLSFTLLLSAMAAEFGVNVKFNAVDIPETWGMDEELGMVFYRHINAVTEKYGRKQIFDLAMREYDTGYPQRYIERNEAIALLYNNWAVDTLGTGDTEQAAHFIKVALSLNPQNPDLWINYGVILKRGNQRPLAVKAFEHAITLAPNSTPAASNLERFYREQGEPRKAKAYKRIADRARRNNPYFHYTLATEEYRKKRYRAAMKHTKKAIRMHNSDPRFYELQSIILQQNHNYKAALKSLEKAHKLAFGEEQRTKYYNIALAVSERAVAEYERRQRQGERINVEDELRRAGRFGL